MECHMKMPRALINLKFGSQKTICFGNPAIPVGPVPARRSACPRKAGLVGISAYRHSCVSARRRGFPPSDHSKLGFVGNSFKILKANLMPKSDWINYLIYVANI